MDDEWLSTTEAAQRLGISHSERYQLIADGQPTGYRFGRVVRLKRKDADRWRS